MPRAESSSRIRARGGAKAEMRRTWMLVLQPFETQNAARSAPFLERTAGPKWL